MKRNITIDDVAREAGVSRQTVSRAINNKGEISPVTQQRVMDAIQKLGYRPSRVAQGLATKRTFMAGLVISDIANPFFPNVARGVQDAARAAGYNVFVCNSDESLDEELKTLQTLAAQGVDGIILFPNYRQETTLLQFIHQYRPLVVINNNFEHPHISRVLTDNYRGVHLAIDYLTEKGHTRIGMVNGWLPSQHHGRRYRGFIDAMQAHNLPIAEGQIISGAPTLETGYQSTSQLLQRHSDLTAIFAYNDLLAVGAIRACRSLGRRVPEDCAIVGFDDTYLASLVSPALTTIRIEKYRLGQVSMQRLLEMIENPQNVYEPILLDVELVIRESA